VKTGKTSWHTLTASEQEIGTKVKVLLTTAAKQGHAGAQNFLGGIYSKGGGVAQDYKEAARWYRKAAEQGDTEAQNNLGVMYRDSEGFAQDFEEAARWFRKAAK
jgi:TPR repeat protein